MNRSYSVAVNWPFPMVGPVMPGHAGSAVFFLAGGNLCVTAFYPNPPAQMAASWGGRLHYGVFVHDEVPYLVIYFSDGGPALNPGINVLAEVEAGRPAYRDFLDAEQVTVSLTLVDSVSNIVRATRTLAMSDSALGLLRAACRCQLDSGTALDVNASIWEATEMCEASTMLMMSQVHGSLPALPVQYVCAA